MKESEGLIAYCGLYCGDCFNRKGEIAGLAKELRKKLREAKFERASRGLAKYFKQFHNYEQCYEVLGAMVRLHCGRSCREGGGNPFCKVRLCCQKNDIKGCWACGDYESCKKLDFLKPVHGDSVLNNLRRLQKSGSKKYLKGKREF